MAEAIVGLFNSLLYTAISYFKLIRNEEDQHQSNELDTRNIHVVALNGKADYI